VLPYLLAKGNFPMTSIIEKIQKLQALADRAGTEHEAALAAQRVAEMCQRHNLDIGVATLIEEETEASEARYVLPSTHLHAYQSKLAAACDLLFHTYHCYHRGTLDIRRAGKGRFFLRQVEPGTKLVFVGLKANVAAALETYRYLEASVESILDGHVRAGQPLKGRAAFRSFRIGVAHRIYKEALQARAAGEEHFEENEESQAVVWLEHELIRRYVEQNVRGGRGRSRRGATDGGAYRAGFDAGGKVDLHGARSSRMLGAAKS
jgi:hypothetical protein